MLAVILYFTLNFAGFFVFLAIWNLLPKPKPFDYTTIPGLKLKVSSAEEIPELIKTPGDLCDKEFKGHIDEIKKNSPVFRKFLQFLNLTYGPLSSFWWFDRYVVVISNEKLLAELKKFSANLLAISPFSLGSYLNGHAKYCSTAEYGSFKNLRKLDVDIDHDLLEANQDALVTNPKFEEKTSDFTEKYDAKCLNQAGIHYKFTTGPKNSKVFAGNLRKSLGRPLLVVFNREIWIDAHPIPKYVPIIIQTDEIIKNCLDDEIFPKFYAQFYWLPGFSRLNDYF